MRDGRTSKTDLRWRFRALPRALLLLVLVTLTACGSLISPYDAKSYENATSLKASCLTMCDNAAKDAPDVHEAASAALQLQLRQAYEYEKGKGPLNAETTGHWEIMIDPERRLMGGLLARWTKAGKALNATLVEEAKTKNIGPGFDQIIKLLQAKIPNN